MENCGLLDPLNDYHLFALHYVFIPRVNKSLKDFVAAWNNHGVSSERNMTPLQLFTAGVYKLRHDGKLAEDFFDTVDDNYGMDSNGPVPLEEEGDAHSIIIPRIEVSLSASAQE